MSAGTGVRTSKLTVFEKPPPGDGLRTRTACVPPVASSDAAKVVRSSVAETKVVPVFSVSPMKTRDVERKPVPVMVTVVPVLPAVAELGLSDVIAGTGFVRT